ncbi:iron-sulfur cluster repair di-iron protein [Owenweeksia hongkongensis]|uniref:iron-sulfur cluster repair di-iron protein n=1 Tax=Owenweeksia hongkongensis TaxID=253245 RepID=UPI003A8D7ABF
MEGLEQRQIGELVAENYKLATVFKKHKIDFCCQGGLTISDACQKRDISIWEVIRDLEAVINAKEDDSTDYKSWPLDLLTDYIEKKHHRYVEARSQEIKPFLDKLCKVHGDRHPELFEINELFTGSVGELAQHMKKEELVLFPFIRKMVEAKTTGEAMPTPYFGAVENPIAMMMHEHDTEGERFRKIAKLSNDYNPPADACNTYRVTFALLQEFEDDLHKHIHVENNILFSGAKAMEENMKGRELENTL